MGGAVSGDFFELFGLRAGFSIDSDQLAARYRELQRRVHPDRFAGAPDSERRASVQLTAHINEAYQTLRDPIRRAQYLVEQKGGVTEPEPALDPVFLSEQMDVREALSEMKQHSHPQQKLAEMSRETTQAMMSRLALFSSAVESDMTNARRLLRELQFLDKLRREIEAVEESLE